MIKGKGASKVSLRIEKKYEESKKSWDISLFGDVDIETSTMLKEELSAMLEVYQGDINIDCAELSYIDSTGLGVLIGILKRVKNNENEVILSNTQKNMLKLLKITGLDKVFVIK